MECHSSDLPALELSSMPGAIKAVEFQLQIIPFYASDDKDGFGRDSHLQKLENMLLDGLQWMRSNVRPDFSAMPWSVSMDGGLQEPVKGMPLNWYRVYHEEVHHFFGSVRQLPKSDIENYIKGDSAGDDGRRVRWWMNLMYNVDELSNRFLLGGLDEVVALRMSPPPAPYPRKRIHRRTVILSKFGRDKDDGGAVAPLKVACVSGDAIKLRAPHASLPSNCAAVTFHEIMHTYDCWHPTKPVLDPATGDDIDIMAGGMQDMVRHVSALRLDPVNHSRIKAAFDK